MRKSKYFSRWNSENFASDFYLVDQQTEMQGLKDTAKDIAASPFGQGVKASAAFLWDAGVYSWKFYVGAFKNTALAKSVVKIKNDIGDAIENQAQRIVNITDGERATYTFDPSRIPYEDYENLTLTELLDEMGYKESANLTDDLVAGFKSMLGNWCELLKLDNQIQHVAKILSESDAFHTLCEHNMDFARFIAGIASTYMCPGCYLGNSENAMKNRKELVSLSAKAKAGMGALDSDLLQSIVGAGQVYHANGENWDANLVKMICNAEHDIVADFGMKAVMDKLPSMEKPEDVESAILKLTGDLATACSVSEISRRVNVARNYLIAANAFMRAAEEKDPKTQKSLICQGSLGIAKDKDALANSNKLVKAKNVLDKQCAENKISVEELIPNIDFYTFTQSKSLAAAEQNLISAVEDVKNAFAAEIDGKGMQAVLATIKRNLNSLDTAQKDLANALKTLQEYMGTRLSDQTADDIAIYLNGNKSLPLAVKKNDLEKYNAPMRCIEDLDAISKGQLSAKVGSINSFLAGLDKLSQTVMLKSNDLAKILWKLSEVSLLKGTAADEYLKKQAIVRSDKFETEIRPLVERALLEDEDIKQKIRQLKGYQAINRSQEDRDQLQLDIDQKIKDWVQGQIDNAEAQKAVDNELTNGAIEEILMEKTNIVNKNFSHIRYADELANLRKIKVSMRRYYSAMEQRGCNVIDCHEEIKQEPVMMFDNEEPTDVFSCNACNTAKAVAKNFSLSEQDKLALQWLILAEAKADPRTLAGLVTRSALLGKAIQGKGELAAKIGSTIGQGALAAAGLLRKAGQALGGSVNDFIADSEISKLKGYLDAHTNMLKQAFLSGSVDLAQIDKIDAELIKLLRNKDIVISDDYICSKRVAWFNAQPKEKINVLLAIAMEDADKALLEELGLVEKEPAKEEAPIVSDSSTDAAPAEEAAPARFSKKSVKKHRSNPFGIYNFADEEEEVEEAPAEDAESIEEEPMDAAEDDFAPESEDEDMDDFGDEGFGDSEELPEEDEEELPEESQEWDMSNDEIGAKTMNEDAEDEAPVAQDDASLMAPPVTASQTDVHQSIDPVMGGMSKEMLYQDEDADKFDSKRGELTLSATNAGEAMAMQNEMATLRGISNSESNFSRTKAVAGKNSSLLSLLGDKYIR